MGRFFKEMRYSMKMRRHLFFLMLVWFAAVGAVWLFQGTVDGELHSSFPGDYGIKNDGKLKEYKVAGYYDDMAAVTDSDLKAEILFNQALHGADWMSYREIVVDNLYVRAYVGTDLAIVGYESGNYTGNKDVDVEGTLHSRVNTIWMDETSVKEAGLGIYAERLFQYPNDYIDQMFVVLGAGLEGDYQVGDVMQVRTSQGSMKAYVRGFLNKGAKAEVDGKSINLDYYIVCPLDNMDNLYEGKTETMSTHTNPVYLYHERLTEDMTVCDTTMTNPTMVAEEKEYRGVKALWLSRDVLNIDETAPEWLRAFVSGQSHLYNSIAVGANYKTLGLMNTGNGVDLQGTESKLDYVCTQALPQGTMYTVDGQEICLDDYIVFVLPDYNKLYSEEGENPGAVVTPTPIPDGGEDAGTEGEDAGTGITPGDSNVSTEEIANTYSVAERTKLFYILFLKNRGYFETVYAPNEAQRKLSVMTEASWKNFYLENEGKDAITTYCVREADEANSILYRDDISGMQAKLAKVAKWGFVLGAALLVLYYFLKLRCGKEYYTTIVMTGTSSAEVMALYLLEGILLFALATAVGYVGNFAICKLLHLQSVGMSGLIKRNLLAIGLPTLAISLWALICDYGKIFRRVRG